MTAARVRGERVQDETVLESRGLDIGYGDLAVAREISVSVRKGEVVALLGPNGVGKTTLLLTLAGVIRPLRGEVRLHGEPTTAPLHRRARRGLGFVADDRSVIFGLTARDNLRVGAAGEQAVTSMFPELKALLGRRAGLLSGGEQQMLTVARALARVPAVLMVDELSQGLAPLVSQRLITALRASADNGMGVLLVEQSVRRSLAVADRICFLKSGRIVLEGASADFAGRESELEQLYIST
jgi:branched-chain amino acid transport system ATP-binding protein